MTDDDKPIRITLTSVGVRVRGLVVVARCACCHLVASRLLEEDAADVAALIGAEALEALGCIHVDAVTLVQRKSIA